MDIIDDFAFLGVLRDPGGLGGYGSSLVSVISSMVNDKSPLCVFVS